MSATALQSATASVLSPPERGVSPANDEALYEVVNGQRVELPPMGAYATWISGRLYVSLFIFCQASRAGTALCELLFILDANQKLRRRPDIAFISAEHWPLDQAPPETGDWAIVPDLAVEVISPNDLFCDVLAKMREYFAYGVRQVWIVLPVDRQVYIYTSPTAIRVAAAGEELDGGSLLPGFRLPLADLFAPAAAVQAIAGR